MAKKVRAPAPPHYFRRLDVLAWGSFAALVWSFAIATLTSAALMPSEVHEFLHGSRVDPQSMLTLRSGVNKLYASTRALEAQTNSLIDRLNAADSLQKEVSNRVVKLEEGFPKLALAAGLEDTDPIVTGSTDLPVKRIDVPGGSVAVTTLPLGAAIDRLSADKPEIDPRIGRGIALGPPLTAAEADSSWTRLVDDAGTLLLGLKPLLSVPDEKGQSRIIVGPVIDTFTATQLCQRLDDIGIACSPVPYTGTPIASAESPDDTASP